MAWRAAIVSLAVGRGHSIDGREMKKVLKGDSLYDEEMLKA